MTTSDEDAVHDEDAVQKLIFSMMTTHIKGDVQCTDCNSRLCSALAKWLDAFEQGIDRGLDELDEQPDWDCGPCAGLCMEGPHFCMNHHYRIKDLAKAGERGARAGAKLREILMREIGDITNWEALLRERESNDPMVRE